jgi:hypothetical protein
MVTDTAPQNALTISEEAEKALAFADTAAQLQELAESSKRIVEITNPAGYAECHASRMALKNKRIEIQKRGKGAREDAAKFAKEVIAVEGRLIAIISPEEERLQTLQDAEDERRAAEKQSAVDAEKARLAEHEAKLPALIHFPLDCLDCGAEQLADVIETFSRGELAAKDWDEFIGRAEEARAASLRRLHQMLEERRAAEARQAELDRQAAELEQQRQAQEAERIAQEAEAAAQREEMARQQAAAAAEAERQAKRERILGSLANVAQLAPMADRATLDKISADLGALSPKPEDPELEAARQEALAALKAAGEALAAREAAQAQEQREAEERERLARAERDRQEHEQREARRREEEAEAGRRAQAQQEEERRLAAEKQELEERRQAIERQEAEQRERAAAEAKRALEDRAETTDLAQAAAAALELLDVEGLGEKPEAILLRLVLARRQPRAEGEPA